MIAAKFEHFTREPQGFFLDRKGYDQHMQLLEASRDPNLLAHFRPEIAVRQDVGLVIGRFHPPHPGHFDVFEMALWYTKKIKIGIGSANVIDQDKNPFPIEIRKQEIWDGLRRREIEHNVIEIVHLNDYVDDKFWLKETLRKTGDIDIVVGNNGWVNGIFQRGGIRTQGTPYIDRERFQGTVIREELVRKGILRFYSI